jgi:uncharacterized protein YndB with AHSA1/START domain
LFRAWTRAEELAQWFAVAPGFTVPIAEVDLHVGGRYRIGMQAPGESQIMIVGGEYRTIVAPQKLVFTWRWEGSPEDEPETLVTIRFDERAGLTEMVLRHELFTDAATREKHRDGWEGCLLQLEGVIYK